MDLEKIINKIKNKIAPYLFSAAIGIGSLVGCDSDEYICPDVWPIEDQVVNEKEELSILIQASLVVGVEYRLENAPADMFIETLVIAGFPYYHFIKWTPNYDDAGTYNVTLVADDGYYSDSEDFAVTVNNTPCYKIAFASQLSGFTDVGIVNEDNSGQVNLTSNNPVISTFYPKWSPDGTKILFESEKDGNREIYTVDISSLVQTRLTNNSALDDMGSWSPDGTKITFRSYRDGNGEIYTMNSADGSNQDRLTNNMYNDYSPIFSPDGTKIAFVSIRDGNTEIYKMDIDGSNQTNLTNNSANEYDPRWSPDGTKIAFCSNRDGNYEIYIMDGDGSNIQRFTN
ncbi:hypothetical protein KY342_06010, partial [Candidatus Woesearchaeota archaeon]|nr:hypothetical protein [Candidatus Woesearchaeota archaeon]